MKDQKRNKPRIVKQLLLLQGEGYIEFPGNLETARLSDHISAKLLRDDLFYENCDGIFTTFSFEEYGKIAKTSNVVMAVTVLMAIKLRYFTTGMEHQIPICSLGISNLVEITNISRPTLMRCLDEMTEQKLIYRVQCLHGTKYNGDTFKIPTIYSSMFIGKTALADILRGLADKWNLKSIEFKQSI